MTDESTTRPSRSRLPTKERHFDAEVAAALFIGQIHVAWLIWQRNR